MTHRLTHLAAVLALGLVFAAPVLAQDPVIKYAPDDAAMEVAIADAKASLPLFLDHVLTAEGVSVDGALVKVEFPTVGAGDMESEHIWVMPFARSPEGAFAGLLANDPVNLGALRQGDRVDFTQGMISDWHLTGPSGRYWGSYTSRVIHAAGAFGDTPFDQIFEASPVPPDWQ
jgi:uncharacterized protein YegJ (DUF2314 family)